MALIKNTMFSYSAFTEKSLSVCRYLAIIGAVAAPISTAVTSIACVGIVLTWLFSGQIWQSLKISAQQPAGKCCYYFLPGLLSAVYTPILPGEIKSPHCQDRKNYFTLSYYLECFMNRSGNHVLFTVTELQCLSPLLSPCLCGFLAF